MALGFGPSATRASQYIGSEGPSRNVARFGQDFPGAGGSELVLNHRSRREIVDLLSHFGQGMTRVQGEGDPPLRAYEKLGPFKGPCGIKPDLISFPDTSKEAPAIAQIIDQAVKAGDHYRDHCVLVSGNDRLAKIAAQLEAMGLPVLYFGSLFERPEIKDCSRSCHCGPILGHRACYAPRACRNSR
jgi:superfamily I DNA/RNA helicase